MADRGGRGGRGAPRGQGRGGGGDRGGGDRGGGDRGGGARGGGARGGGARGEGGGRGGQRGDRGGARGAPRGGGQQYGRLGDDEYTRGPDIYTPSGGETTPSQAVHAKEDAVVASNKELSLDTLSLADFKLPLRPGYGTIGRVIHLRTNYFAMAIDPNKSIYKYTVSIKAERKKRKGDGMEQEEPKPGRKQRQAFSILFEEQEFRALHPGLATDYANSILTSTPLKLGPTKSKVFNCIYRDVEDRVARPNATRYSFTITEAGTVPTQELLRYLASTTTDPSDFAGRADAVQALNIIVARTPNLEPQVFQSGQNKFYKYPTNEQEYLDLTGGLIAVRGYYSSVRTATARILLNLNAQTSPFYPACGMIELIEKFGLGRWLDTEKFIQKLRVKTQYLKDEKKQVEVKVKTVQGFSHRRGEERDKKTGKMKRVGNADGDHGDATQIKFDCSEFPSESPISVQQYFLKKHRITLKFPKAWVLNCGTADLPVWIPPELCTVMPGQPYRGKLDERQTTNILNVAARPPAENARRIAGDGQQVVGIRGSGTAALSAFGLKVNTNMLVVLGRVLPTPPVMYKGSSVKTEQAAWNMRNKQFSVPRAVLKWSFLRLGPVEFGKAHIDIFKQALKAGGLGQADPVSPPGQQGFSASLVLGQDDANDDKLKAVLKHASSLQIQILLVILPGKGPMTYNRVKYWADVECGIHTVCAVNDKVQKEVGKGMGGMQYFANLTLKFNLKMGGANQLLPPDRLGFLKDGDTMIVGIDVTHPAPGNMEGTPSIAAVVSSVNSQYAQWPGSIRCQESKQEMVSALQVMMEERLEYWIKENKGNCPRRILIYRDGVSEGQYQKVLVEEFTQILEACKKIYQKHKAPRPKINILVVGKRHHTRFYPTEEKYADMNSRVKGNPPNGTVVDRGVTMEKGHDFFLQAHVALQGTAKPAHYVVLVDEMKLGADELQNITHNLCYLFGRATRAVSICPPAYYADILCERGRCYLHKYVTGFHPRGAVFDFNASPWFQGVHKKLENTMFYI